MSIGVDITGKQRIETTAVVKWDDSNLQKQTEQYPPFQEMQSEQGAENLQSLNETINNNTDSFKVNTAIMKEFGDVMPEIVKNLRYMNSVVAQTTSSLPAIGKVKTSEEQKKQRLAEYNRQNFLNVFNTGSGALQSLSGGNIGGAGIGLISGASNAVSNYSKIADMKDLEKLSTGLLAGGTAIAAAAAVFKGGKALSDAYKDAMPSIFDTGKAFGTTDNEESMRLYKTVNKYSEGTNLENSQFNALVQSLRKQGVGNEYNSRTSQAIAASQIAETTAKWAYATGGDANQYAQLAGLMSRYGGSKNVSEDFNYLVASGKAQGLNDTQIPEFLSGIQKVMEEGIAKGFTRSSKEVADTMLMFSKMSGGNAFWQTEKGAQMLGQMNSGVASATSLSKTSDILTYQAFRNVYKDDKAVEAELNKDSKNKTYIKGGSYVNMMQLIEQGVNADNFGAIMQAAKDASGGDVNAETEFLRDIFGLNYTGVGKLKNLDLTKIKDRDELEKQLQDITQSPENQNNETKWKNDLNRVAQALESGGAKIFGSITLKGMDVISTNVDKIAKYLIKDGTKEDLAQDNPVSTDNNFVEALENNGVNTEELQEKIDEINEKARENFSYGQNVLLNDYTKRINVDSSGSQLDDAYDFIENYDSENQLYKQPFNPVIVKRTKGTGIREKDRQKNLEKNPYELAPYATEKDVTPLAAVLSLPETHAKYSSLLAGGKVSAADFMDAIAQSKDVSDAVKGSTNLLDRQYSTKDLEKINNSLEKIFNELANGISYNENK